WPIEQLRERVRFSGRHAKGKHASIETRLADIVVYDAAAESKAATPLMIVEYVGGEDRDAVARWWLSETPAKVVAIMSSENHGTQQRLYSKKHSWDSEATHSSRWDLPLPHDFKALEDPTDVSVDTLLEAVRGGHAHYLERLVSEWVRSSAATLHGGAPWKPQIARKILDSL